MAPLLLICAICGFDQCPTQPMSAIVLSHIGVHQMFQLALAAQEMGELDRLYCSLLDAPGKWGRLLSGRTHAASLRPLGAEQLAPDRVTEIPWPLLARRIKEWVTRKPSDYFRSNCWFDRLVASKLESTSAGIFVGSEACALESFRVAGARGMKRILDCHGIPAEFLQKQMNQAAADLGIRCATVPFSARMNERKAEERDLADLVLVCSELQRAHYVDKGLPKSKLRVNPLWVDPTFLGVACPRQAQPSGSPPRDSDTPLRVLFVGHATVAKGAPYALKAVELLGDRVRLTYCGGVDDTVRRWAGDRLTKHRVMDRVSRSQLSQVYAEHEVLLFPTLGDSFGFVALEAMACGLPVVSTPHAGAPLPDEGWRVPSHDAQALAAKLERYAADRDLLAADSARAVEFARQFTPEQYRRRAAAIFRELL